MLPLRWRHLAMAAAMVMLVGSLLWSRDDKASAATASSPQAHPRRAATEDRCLAGDDGNAYGLVATTAYYRNASDDRVEFRMAVLGSDDVVSTWIQKQGFWEINDGAAELGDRFDGRRGGPTNAAIRALEHRPTFLDVGGNLGYYSLVYAHSGFDVIAVEPMSRNRAAIKASLCLNPELVPHLTLVPAAVGDAESSSLKCQIASPTGYANKGNGVLTCSPDLAPCGDRSTGGNCEDIRSTTLDALLTELAPRSIDVVKIDIEGFECPAVNGGRSMLFGEAHTGSHRPALVQFELRHEPTKTCIPKLMEELGYITGATLSKGWGDDYNTIFGPGK